MQTLQLSIFPDVKCTEHGIWDSFPCPWPGCEHGHPDVQFQVSRTVEGESPTIYTRRKWTSPLGGIYYTWDSSKLPNWFFAPKTLWNEARRNGLVDDRAPRLVYHYTSLEGFVGIVQSRSLWLSDYSYLNDKRELTYGAELVRDVANEILASPAEPKVQDVLQTWIKNLGELENRICVASFSAEDDSLSQWRSYGTIALGFEPHVLGRHVNQSYVRPVEYHRVTQRRLIEIYLHHLCQAYAVDSSEGRLERIPDVYHKTERLLELIAFFKDPAFRTEQEYRLAFIENTEVLGMFGQTKTPKHFRVARSRLLPYVSSEEILPSPHRDWPLEIGEVVLGPEADDLLERGVRELLDSEGMADVQVRRSSVPYRT